MMLTYVFRGYLEVINQWALMFNIIFPSIVINRVTFGFGVVATAVSLYLFSTWIRSPYRIGKAVAFMLFGELCGNLNTTIFAAEQLFPSLVFTDSFKTGLRWAIYIPVAFSSIHLSMCARQVIEEKEKKNTNES